MDQSAEGSEVGDLPLVAFEHAIHRAVIARRHQKVIRPGEPWVYILNVSYHGLRVAIADHPSVVGYQEHICRQRVVGQRAELVEILQKVAEPPEGRPFPGRYGSFVDVYGLHERVPSSGWRCCAC